MSDLDLMQYSKLLKEGLPNCKEYLYKNVHLFEMASSKLNDLLSIENIILFCMNKNQLKDIELSKRKEFAKTVFEIYFNYSKNFLLHFDIYCSKSITEHTSQLLNHLGKIPSFSDHLLTIGYVYTKESREWKCLDTSLTKKRKDDLLKITISCCLGIGYLDEPLKFLNLSIFEKRRKSLLSAIKGRNCEYCNYELNEERLCCSVCDQSIDHMTFFERWEFDYSMSLSDSFPDYVQQNESTNDSGIATVQEHGDEPEQWSCVHCSFRNSMDYIVCDACFHPKSDNNNAVEINENEEVADNSNINNVGVNNDFVDGDNSDGQFHYEMENSQNDRQKCKVCSSLIYSNGQCTKCADDDYDNEPKLSDQQKTDSVFIAISDNNNKSQVERSWFRWNYDWYKCTLL